jgi:AraC-like DNA-binding protein
LEVATPSLAVPSGPVSWYLERDGREVTFNSCREISVYTDTASILSSPHALPAWTLLVPVDGGSVKVFSDGTGRVDDDAVLIPPQTWHRVKTHGAHVAVYLGASMAARASNERPRRISAAVARRMLDALAVDSAIDPSSALAGLDPSFQSMKGVDPRVTAVIDALPGVPRIDVLAAEIGMSPSRLRAVVRDTVGVPLTQLRLWSRLGHALALLPFGSAADAAATAGFADQAHLTRTARRFLGRTPAEMFLRSLALRPPNPRWRGSASAAARH